MDTGFALALLEHSPDALLLLDQDGTISFLNSAAEQLFGYSRSQLMGAEHSLLLAEMSREPFHLVLSRLATAGAAGSATPPPRTRPFEGAGRRADGTQVSVEITCSLVPLEAGPAVALSVRSAAHRQNAPQPVSVPPDAGTAAGGNSASGAAPRRRPFTAVPSVPSGATARAGADDRRGSGGRPDPLTGLANGPLFNDQLAAALSRPETVDVLILNLDDFRNLNELLGHPAGDELLVDVANRLRSCIRPHDSIARLGGDEFVVLLVKCLNADAATKRIAESLHEPIRVGGSLVRPSVSMGLASRTPETADGAELLRQAHAAMGAAKAAGKNTWRRFEPRMLYSAAQQGQGESGLRRAVELGQISVHYQPVVAPGVGCVVQFEAFARWELHGRVVPPNQFLPMAEQSGLIREIGDEVLRRACTEIRPWLAGDAANSVAVNVSALQFEHRDFAADVLAIVRSTEVDPRQLTLELTESVFFDSAPDVLRQLRQLRQAGVRIAMDDFGTGYSALGRLNELPLDIVKIDRSFVAMVSTGQEQLPFFDTMIDAAHALGLTVTAEGIETGIQARYLMDRGCDSLQGYLFAKPAPASELAGTMETALMAVDQVGAGR